MNAVTLKRKHRAVGVAVALAVALPAAERYVPITVRSASTAGAVVILDDNTTWQAYNTWGGYSLHQGPDGLPSDRGYSQAMRNALLTARNAGTNLAFLGANAIYRHIRFAGEDQVIICYQVATLDPLCGNDDAETTQQWPDPPDPRPESVITGVFYECNPVSAPWVGYDPSNWIFAGTGAYRGESFPGMVGPEYDRLNPAVPFPRPMQVLAHSPLTCDGYSTYSDSVYHTVASGAGVFASGTMRWVCAMRGPSCGHGLNRAAERFVDRATQNLLRAFAAGPAARAPRAGQCPPGETTEHPGPVRRRRLTLRGGGSWTISTRASWPP